MRKWCGLFLAGAVALCLAAPSSAAQVAFSSTFSLDLGSFPTFEVINTGNLEATIVGNDVTAFTVPVSVFKLDIVQDVVPDVVLLPGVATLLSVSVTATNQKGAFTKTAMDGGEGLMKFDGDASLKIKLAGNPAVGKLPLEGAIGTEDKVKASLFGLVPVTLSADPWTLGTGKAISTPLGGGAKVTLMRTGMFSVVGDQHRFTYITPTQITINLTPISRIASFGTLEIDLTVPEAGNALLLATGAAVLLALGYRRSQA